MQTALMLASISIPAKAIAGDEQRIVDAWKAQQSAVASFQCDFVEQRKTLAGAQGLDLRSGRPLPKQPPQDVAHDIVHRLLVADQRMAYEYAGNVWRMHSRAFERRAYRSAWDGETSLTYLPSVRASDGSVADRAIINTERHSPDAQTNAYLQPVLYALRPIDPVAGLVPRDSAQKPIELDLVGEVEHAGKRALHVRLDSTREVWLDPARGYLPVRYVVHSPDRKRVWLKIEWSEYLDTEQGVHLPKAWRILMGQPSTGRPLVESTVRDAKYAVNPPVAPEAFRITLPAHVKIQDNFQVELRRQRR
jgi:hypothetical protein